MNLFVVTALILGVAATTTDGWCCDELHSGADQSLHLDTQVMSDEDDHEGLLKATFFDAEEMPLIRARPKCSGVSVTRPADGQEDEIGVTLNVSPVERPWITAVMERAGLQLCFTSYHGGLRAVVHAGKDEVLKQLCDQSSVTPFCARDAKDAVLEKLRRSSIGSYAPAYVPDLEGLPGEIDEEGFVAALALTDSADTLRGIRSELMSSGFYVAFAPTGTSYLVEAEPTSTTLWLRHLLDNLTVGREKGMQKRAHRAMCVAFRKTSSPLCSIQLSI